MKLFLPLSVLKSTTKALQDKFEFQEFGMSLHARLYIVNSLFLFSLSHIKSNHWLYSDYLYVCVTFLLQVPKKIYACKTLQEMLLCYFHLIFAYFCLNLCSFTSFGFQLQISHELPKMFSTKKITFPILPMCWMMCYKLHVYAM